MSRGIEKDFFNSFLYSLFKAIGEKIGEESWRIVWRTGEILFNELKEKVKFKKKEPIEVIRSLARYLKKAGYLKNSKIFLLNDEEFEYWMREPVIEKGAFKLIEEGYPPPHISTSLLFSALKNFTGSEISLVGNPKRNGKWIVERWKIKKLS